MSYHLRDSNQLCSVGGSMRRLTPPLQSYTGAMFKWLQMCALDRVYVNVWVQANERLRRPVAL